MVLYHYNIRFTECDIDSCEQYWTKFTSNKFAWQDLNSFLFVLQMGQWAHSRLADLIYVVSWFTNSFGCSIHKSIVMPDWIQGCNGTEYIAYSPPYVSSSISKWEQKTGLTRTCHAKQWPTPPSLDITSDFKQFTFFWPHFDIYWNSE
jgi:hypothetical protein